MKTRIITARLKFSPRKAGGDMSEAQLSDWLANALNFADGLDVDTVLDGDPLSALTGKGAVRRLADAMRMPDASALMLAALKEAQGVISELSHQCGQMRGMFSDDDGTIAEAIEEGEAAFASIAAAIAAAEGREG